MRARATRCAWLVMVMLVWLGGCGDDGAGADAGPDAGAVDAGGSDAAPDDAASGGDGGGSCDVGGAPDGLPALDGSFVVRGADGGVGVPTAMGGEPVGVWRFDTATFYVEPESGDLLKEDESTITGDAWAVIGETDFRLQFFFDLTLETTVAGTIRRSNTFVAKGTYVQDGPILQMDGECSSAGAGESTMDFTENGDRGTMITTVESMMGGETVIVLEGSLASE